MCHAPQSDNGPDLQLTNVLNAGEELEPLALIRHRDHSASLVVRRGLEQDMPISRVYLSDDGAPECP